MPDSKLTPSWRQLSRRQICLLLGGAGLLEATLPLALNGFGLGNWQVGGPTVVKIGPSLFGGPMAFSPDGRFLAVSTGKDWPGKAQMKFGIQWRDADSGTLLRQQEIPSYDPTLPAIQVSEDGQEVSLHHETEWRWNLATNVVQESAWPTPPRSIRVVHAQEHARERLTTSPRPPDYEPLRQHGHFYVMRHGDRAARGLYIWDDRRAEIRHLCGPGVVKAVDFFYGITVAPESQQVFLWDQKNFGYVFDFATGREQARLPTPLPNLTGAVFSRDGQMLATSDQKQVWLWKLNPPTLLRTITPEHKVYCLMFSPDGTLLACGGRSSRVGLRKHLALKWQDLQGRASFRSGVGEVTLYDTASGYRRSTLRSGSYIGNLAFSRDGRRLAANGSLGYNTMPPTTGIFIWRLR